MNLVIIIWIANEQQLHNYEPSPNRMWLCEWGHGQYHEINSVTVECCNEYLSVALLYQGCNLITVGWICVMAAVRIVLIIQVFYIFLGGLRCSKFTLFVAYQKWSRKLLKCMCDTYDFLHCINKKKIMIQLTCIMWRLFHIFCQGLRLQVGQVNSDIPGVLIYLLLIISVISHTWTPRIPPKNWIPASV